MKSKSKILLALALTGLIAACSEHVALNTKPAVAVVKPQVKVQPIVTLNAPVIPPGQQSVEDILLNYGPYMAYKLKPYFDQAKVSYPPREITLVALKQERKLELWARDSGEFRFIHAYKIRAASGVPGPKLRQGDQQVPEGVYRIVGLNPHSRFHLSMKLNYPNEFDQLHAAQEGRSNLGADIFIHGRAVSIGCLAIGDEAIEELFVLTAQVGAENAKVVIAPHDPRAYPLQADTMKSPAWTSELYAMISDEINALPLVMKTAKAKL